jgi:hypothetical protein
LLKFVILTGFFSWTGIFCQERPTLRKTSFLEFPSSDAAYLNPALITEGYGQSAILGIFSDSVRANDFISMRSRLFHNIYLGLSVFEFGDAALGDSPSLFNNVYIVSTAYRYGFSLPWLKALSSGANLICNQQDIFGLASRDYQSLDAGLNAHILDSKNIGLKSGFVFQNLKSNPMGDSHIFKKYMDWSVFAAFWKNRLYFSGTMNVFGGGEEVKSKSLLRFGGLFRNAVYGVRPLQYLDLSLKYKSDDAAWISLDGSMPCGWIFDKLRYLHLIMELSNDRLKAVPSEPRTSIVLMIKLETAFGKSRIAKGSP